MSLDVSKDSVVAFYREKSDKEQNSLLMVGIRADTYTQQKQNFSNISNLVKITNIFEPLNSPNAVLGTYIPYSNGNTNLFFAALFT